MKERNDSRKVLEGVTALWLLLMATVFLLWPGTGGYMSISAAKYRMFLILCGGYCGLILLLCAEEILIGGMKAPSLRTLWKERSWAWRLAVVYLLLTWLSALCSPHFPETVRGVSRNEGALTVTLYVLCFLFASVHLRLRRWMLPAAALTLLAFDAVCILQLMGGNPFGLYPEGMNYFDANIRYSGAYLGTVGNVDHVASLLSVAVPLLWVALVRLKGRQRLLPAVVLAVTLWVLWKMWVLAALVGILLGSALALPWALPMGRKGRRRTAAAVVGLLLLFVLAVFLRDPGSGFLHELHELLRGRGEDSFGSGRIYIWRNVLERVGGRLWLGHGPDTMLLAEIPPFTRVDPVLGVIRARIDTAHNEYLNVLFHQGLPALLAYLGMLLCALWGWIRRGCRTAAGAAAGTAVVCYSLQACFGISVCITTPFLWIALALLERENRAE